MKGKLYTINGFIEFRSNRSKEKDKKKNKKKGTKEQWNVIVVREIKLKDIIQKTKKYLFVIFVLIMLQD